MVVRRRFFTAARRRPVMTVVWFLGIRFDLRYSQRRGYRLVSWAVWEGCGHQRKVVTYEERGVPKKPGPPGKDGAGRVRAADPCQMFAKTPTLQSYLIDLTYEDTGEPRKPSRLFIDPGEGDYRVVLKDPTECRQVRCRVRDLGTAWVTLEALLNSDTCPWEIDTYELDKRPKKKK